MATKQDNTIRQYSKPFNLRCGYRYSGGSGMRASLQLARGGMNVAVLTKVFPTRSYNGRRVQGGIGASLGNMSDDNWHFHFMTPSKVLTG